jgi:outer membrane autotransporter protein
MQLSTTKLLNAGLGIYALSYVYASSTYASISEPNTSFEMPGLVYKHGSRDGMHFLMQVVTGQEVTIDASVLADSYDLYDGALLNMIDGAIAQAVDSDDSRINAQSSVITAGLYLTHSDAMVVDSKVGNEDGFGISIGASGNRIGYGSNVSLFSSSVVGQHYGIGLGLYGTLKVTDTEVRGSSDSSTGILAANGKLDIQDGSKIYGAKNGIEVIDGYDFVPPTMEDKRTIIRLNNSLVEGGSGAAILVHRPDKYATEADIIIENNAQLLAGNGHLLDIQDGSTVNLLVDNSELEGDLVADETSRFKVNFQNGAQLTGKMTNVASLTLSSAARWLALGDSQIGTLDLQDGVVAFADGGGQTLSIGTLSGRGLFDMRINLDDGTGDLLSVNGEASGRHRLRIQNTGIEAVPAEFDPLRVVHTEGGDAEFGLVGGRADLGVYSYELERQGTDWFIVGSGKEISPSTQSALALFNTAPTVWNSELTTLRSRMGEVRGQEQGGGWMRTYGSRFNAALDSGVDYSQKQQGLSFGADAPVPVGNGQLLLGLMGGYSKSDLDIGRGTSGQVDSYYVGAYGTWLSEGGYYLDGVLKLNQFHNESKVAMSDGTKAKGDYSSKALGGSLEVGKHIKLGDEYFVEPFAQVSSVWIDGSSYTLDNGMQARTNQTQSVLGKVGSTLGRSFALKDGGVVKPYARVALAHEFSRSNDVSVNGQRFDNDLFGSRAELGAGVSVSLSERLQVHADFDYMKGEHVEQPWGANVGVRLAF